MTDCVRIGENNNLVTHDMLQRKISESTHVSAVFQLLLFLPIQAQQIVLRLENAFNETRQIFIVGGCKRTGHSGWNLPTITSLVALWRSMLEVCLFMLSTFCDRFTRNDTAFSCCSAVMPKSAYRLPGISLRSALTRALARAARLIPSV